METLKKKRDFTVIGTFNKSGSMNYLNINRFVLSVFEGWRLQMPMYN